MTRNVMLGRVYPNGRERFRQWCSMAPVRIATHRRTTMNIALRVCTAFVCCLPALAGAQDLTITNARILDGTGKVIDNGTIVITAGKIVSVAANAAPARRGRG